MRVNLIGNFAPNTGLTQDAVLLRGILTAVYGDDVQIRKIPYQFPQCEEADVNVFLESINPSLIPYAGRNIWIPNPEWTHKSWEPYAKMVDEIWLKAHDHSVYFPTGTYTAWTSIDKIFPPRKNYHKAIVLVGKNQYRNPKALFQAYDRISIQNPELYKELPILHVVAHGPFEGMKPPHTIADKVKMFGSLKESEYDELLQECGLAICLSLAEGFGHAVNEAMSAGCNLILSKIAPFRELTISADFVNSSQIVSHPRMMCDLVDSSVPHLMQLLEEYVDRSFADKKQRSLAIRLEYEVRHSKWVETAKELVSAWKTEPYSLSASFPKEEDLPDVSIVTVTKDRRVFMPLAKYSYMIQSYPEDKLEWVIVDDGKDPIEDTLIGVPNVTYVRVEEEMTIGAKRNLGVEKAMYDTIVMMDDDDVYPNNSVLHRVVMMKKNPEKGAVFCTTIPCYDITKYSSFMNVPPYQLPMAERVSEATLGFTRAFWEERKFDDIQIAEGCTFIQGRESMCREISPQEVIVSLTHPKNTSTRKIPEFKEPNGCHFGFNEKLFAVVSEIGQALNTSSQKATCDDHGASSSCGDGGDQP